MLHGWSSPTPYLRLPLLRLEARVRLNTVYLKLHLEQRLRASAFAVDVFENPVPFVDTAEQRLQWYR